MTKHFTAIILASGTGSRTGLDTPKQFLKLAGRPILEHTLRVFASCLELHEIIVVAHPDFLSRTIEITDCVHGVPVRVIAGGRTRQESSYKGILSCPRATHVLIHDAVRPLVSRTLIRKIIRDLEEHDAIDVCIASPDTVIVRSGAYIDRIPPRADMMLGQTPQAFKRDLILRAHAIAESEGRLDSTDDCNLVLRLGKPVFIEEGERVNMKITHLDDLYLVERLFQVARLRGDEPACDQSSFNHALILGGTKGLGLSLASLLKSQGVDTMVAGRHTNPGVDVCSGESVKAFVLDLHSANLRFDCVVYTAGLLLRRTIAEYSENDWESTFKTNLTGVLLFLQQLEKLLRPGGHFLVLGSSSYSWGRAGYAAYSSSKAALINLIQAASDEYPGFKLNVISPQRANTQLRAQAFGKESRSDLLEPDEIALRISQVLGTDLTGMNFDLRVDAPLIARVAV